MLVSRESEKLVHNAEIKMAMFLSEHNLSFRIMDHFSELAPKLFPDSPTALRFKSKRTKTRNIITNACAPHFHDSLKARLQDRYFSIIIDETTDISTSKELAIVCRYYDARKKAVISHFYDMIPLANSTTESIYNHIAELFEADDIPMSNIVGFAADTTNSMFGEHNSVVSRLKAAYPHIYFMKCICHTAHLCSSYACEKLP